VGAETAVGAGRAAFFAFAVFDNLDTRGDTDRAEKISQFNLVHFVGHLK
jgi:hypothetical protein